MGPCLGVHGRAELWADVELVSLAVDYGYHRKVSARASSLHSQMGVLRVYCRCRPTYPGGVSPGGDSATRQRASHYH